MKRAVHQFGFVGGEDYDSKEARLQQLLDRLPEDSGTTIIFCTAASQATVTSAVERCKRKALAAAARCRAERVKAASTAQDSDVAGGAGVGASREEMGLWQCGRCTLENGWLADECLACGARRGAFPKVSVCIAEQAGGRNATWSASSCQIIINYEMPRSSAEYVRRLAAFEQQEAVNLRTPLVAYTFVEEKELKGRQGREMVELLKCTRKCVRPSKKAEIDSALELIDYSNEGEEEDDEEEGDDGEDDDEACDCAHCRGSILGSTSYHPLLPVPGVVHNAMTGIEVVRLPIKGLEDFDKTVPFIAPRVIGHSCTLICLHCLNVHTPWDGWEQFFAPPELTGTMRVVLVLADGLSWHDYPDSALLGAGGSSWVDILDMDSMDRSDMLLERLVDYEAALLNGQSERIVLMGMSQGGGQSMLRFLRSKIRLGGWVGSVCHVPTAPHTPRSRDPVTARGRPTVNQDRPVRLLAGESDSVFTPGLVLGDAARLRDVGGFTDVEVEVRSGLAHEGPLDEYKPAEPASPAKQAVSKRGGRAEAAAPDAIALQRAKSFLKAEKQQPDLLFVQRWLPSMVDFTSTSNPEVC